MAWGAAYSQLPKDLNLTRAAVPNSSLTAVTTVATDVESITVTNTTGATITLNVKDTQATNQFLLDAVNIDPNQPVSLQFDPPESMPGGLQWQASATGLVGTIRGRQHMGLVQGAASNSTNGQLVPV